MGIQAARPVRKNDIGHAAGPRRPRRRSLFHPFDDGEIKYARSGREPDEHRFCSRWISEPGIVDYLRAGQRKPEFADIRGDPRSAWRAAGGTEPLERRLSA